MNEIIIRLINLPTTIHGVTTKDENDDFSIFINARDSNAKQRETLEHEKNHIESGHFYSAEMVSEKEAQTKNALKKSPI